MEREPKQKNSKMQTDSTNSFRQQIVTISCIGLATLLLLSATIGAGQYVEAQVAAMMQSLVDQWVARGIASIDIANKNLQCTNSVVQVDAQGFEAELEKMNNSQRLQTNRESTKHLTDIVPYKYRDGTLVKSLLVYEECKLPKMKCSNWECTPEIRSDTEK